MDPSFFLAVGGKYRARSTALLAEFLQELGALLDDGGAAGGVAQHLSLAPERLAVGVEAAGRILPFDPEPLLLEEGLLRGGHGLAIEAGEGLLPSGVEARLLALDL